MDETTRKLNEHSKKNEQLTKQVDALAYRRPPQSPESQNTNDQGHQETPKVIFSRNMHSSIFQDKCYQKFKNELMKYDDKDHRGFFIWTNKMDSIFESKPLLGEQEKIMITSNNLEGEYYDWFLWWSRKCDARSFHCQSFTTTLLKRFHDEEDNALYNKFVHLKQKGNINNYTHE
jgi:hypothetical protein